MKETFEKEVSNKLAPKTKPTNSMESHLFDFYERSYLSQTKNVNALFLLLFSETKIF